MSFEEQIKEQFAAATGHKFEEMVQLEVDKYKHKIKDAIEQLPCSCYTNQNCAKHKLLKKLDLEGD
jgi:hypothetical protein